MRILEKLKLDYAVAIRTNHGVWLPQEQKVRANQWREFERVFSNGQTQKRYIREIIFGKKRELQYWEITTDKEKLPKDSTLFVMTKIPNVNYKDVGNIYGIRAWIEYEFKQSKNELGWAEWERHSLRTD